MKMSNGVKLIIGLGNPGKKYQKTRHNVGFMVLDALAKEYGVKFENKRKWEAKVAEINSLNPLFNQRGGKGELSKIILAKPQTFMNASGKTVKKLLTTYNLQLTNLLLIHDEIDLPFGQIRLSSSSSAGHKGVESVIAAIGAGFKRLRIGIENRQEYRVPETEKYVLQNFTHEGMKKLKEEIIPKTAAEIQKFLIDLITLNKSQ